MVKFYFYSYQWSFIDLLRWCGIWIRKSQFEGEFRIWDKVRVKIENSQDQEPVCLIFDIVYVRILCMYFSMALPWVRGHTFYISCPGGGKLDTCKDKAKYHQILDLDELDEHDFKLCLVGTALMSEHWTMFSEHEPDLYFGSSSWSCVNCELTFVWTECRYCVLFKTWNLEMQHFSNWVIWNLFRRR